MKCVHFKKSDEKEREIMKVKKSGFTLIEIVVVLTIIGILAMILVPSMIGYVKKSRRSSDITSARTIRNDAAAVLAEGDEDAEDAFYSGGGTVQSVSVEYAGKTENYSIIILAEKEANAMVEWKSTASGTEKFIDLLNAMEDKRVDMKYIDPEGGEKLNRWFLAKDAGDSDRIEVWAGDTSGPKYRVWPQTETKY